jgi:hypothetical protein
LLFLFRASRILVQVPPWQLLLASCLEAIIDGLIRFMADLTLGYIMALFYRRKTRLGFESVGFPKFQLIVSAIGVSDS